MFMFPCISSLAHAHCWFCPRALNDRLAHHLSIQIDLKRDKSESLAVEKLVKSGFVEDDSLMFAKMLRRDVFLWNLQPFKQMLQEVITPQSSAFFLHVSTWYCYPKESSCMCTSRRQDVIMCTAMWRSRGGLGRPKNGKKLWVQIKAEGREYVWPVVRAECNAVISAYTQNRLEKEALRLFGA